MKENGGVESCVRLHMMYTGKDNLVINKTLLLLGFFFFLPGNIEVGRRDGDGGGGLSQNKLGDLC